MARRTLSAAVALAPAAALLLTACGSTTPKASSSITGANDGSAASASPSPSAAAPAGAPAITLPSDVTVDIVSPAPGDATVNAAVADLEYAIRALQYGYSRGSGQVAPMRYAYGQDAGIYWSKLIKRYRDDGNTLTGTDRFYDLKVTPTGATTASGTYCENQRDSFAKNIKTGKIDRTEPSDDDFFLNSVKLAKTQGVWKVSEVSWKRGDRSCVTD